MSGFEFETVAESEAFCEAILDEMVRLFSFPREEALGRMNRVWKGLEILEDDLISHEDEHYWAMNLYYGKGANWWLYPPDLQPLPYP